MWHKLREVTGETIMNVQLDNEQWQANAEATLGDILADLSERAHAKSRIVMTVLLDQHRITDRDIDQHLLQEPIARYRDLVATSATQQEIVESARESIRRYRELIVQEGSALINPFRLGKQDVSVLDGWLGKVADLLELMNQSAARSLPGSSCVQPTTEWIEQLLAARQLRDTVRMADLLEYEILPRLAV